MPEPIFGELQRPPKRGGLVAFRVTDTERQVLDTLTARENCSLADILRDALTLYVTMVAPDLLPTSEH